MTWPHPLRAAGPMNNPIDSYVLRLILPRNPAMRSRRKDQARSGQATGRCGLAVALYICWDSGSPGHKKSAHRMLPSGSTRSAGAHPRWPGGSPCAQSFITLSKRSSTSPPIIRIGIQPRRMSEILASGKVGYRNSESGPQAPSMSESLTGSPHSGQV